MFNIIDDFIRSTLRSYYESLSDPNAIPTIVNKRLAAMERLGDNDWFRTIPKNADAFAKTGERMHKLCYRASRLYALLTGDTRALIQQEYNEDLSVEYENVFPSFLVKFNDSIKEIERTLTLIGIVDGTHLELVDASKLYSICNNPFKFHWFIGRIITAYSNEIVKIFSLDKTCSTASSLKLKANALSATKSIILDIILFAVYGRRDTEFYFNGIEQLRDETLLSWFPDGKLSGFYGYAHDRLDRSVRHKYGFNPFIIHLTYLHEYRVAINSDK